MPVSSARTAKILSVWGRGSPVNLVFALPSPTPKSSQVLGETNAPCGHYTDEKDRAQKTNQDHNGDMFPITTREEKEHDSQYQHGESRA